MGVHQKTSTSIKSESKNMIQRTAANCHVSLIPLAHIYFMYLCRNFLWNSFLMVSLMYRLGALLSPRVWFLNTTSSSHLREPKYKTKSLHQTQTKYTVFHLTDRNFNLKDSNLLFTQKEVGNFGNEFPLRSSASFTLGTSSRSCRSFTRITHVYSSNTAQIFSRASLIY